MRDFTFYNPTSVITSYSIHYTKLYEHPQHGQLFCASFGQEFRQKLVDAIGFPAADLGFDD